MQLQPTAEYNFIMPEDSAVWFSFQRGGNMVLVSYPPDEGEDYVYHVSKDDSINSNSIEPSDNFWIALLETLHIASKINEWLSAAPQHVNPHDVRTSFIDRLELINAPDYEARTCKILADRALHLLIDHNSYRSKDEHLDTIVEDAFRHLDEDSIPERCKYMRDPEFHRRRTDFDFKTHNEVNKLDEYSE